MSKQSTAPADYPRYDLEELYRENAESVYRRIFFKTGNTKDAEDIFQLVWLGVWVWKENNRCNPTKPLVWSIVNKKIADFYRGKERKLKGTVESSLEGLIHDRSSCGDVVEERAGSMVVLEWQWKKLENAALRHLSPVQRQMFELRFGYGYTGEQIRRELRLSSLPESIEDQCRRLRDRVIALLKLFGVYDELKDALDD